MVNYYFIIIYEVVLSTAPAELRAVMVAEHQLPRYYYIRISKTKELSVVCKNLYFARSFAEGTLSKIYDMATFIREVFI